jgi:hypothetical protein
VGERGRGREQEGERESEEEREGRCDFLVSLEDKSGTDQVEA